MDYCSDIRKCPLLYTDIYWTVQGRNGSLWWLRGKESTCKCRRPEFNPWVGKTPWRRAWQPTPVFLPGESHEQRSEWVAVHGVAGSDTTEATKQQQQGRNTLPGIYCFSFCFVLFCLTSWHVASLVAPMVKNLPAMQETQVWSLGQEDPLEEGMATHSQYSCLENPMDRGACHGTWDLSSPTRDRTHAPL